MPSPAQYPTISAIFIVLLAIPSIIALSKASSIKKGLLTYSSLGLLALIIEYIALQTSFPYGEFQYMASLGGKLFGVLPWTIAFAWPPLVIGAYSIALRLSSERSHILIISTLILLVLDLVLDPIAVATGMWAYTTPGFYYDVPLSNFLGWIISGSLGTALLQFQSVRIHNNWAIVGLQISLLLWIIQSIILSLHIPTIIGSLLIVLVTTITKNKLPTTQPHS